MLQLPAQWDDFSPAVVFRGPKRNWHARGPFCNFRAPKLIFWLPGSQPIPKLLALASLPITSSQTAPNLSLRFPATGCSQLGIKTTAELAPPSWRHLSQTTDRRHATDWRHAQRPWRHALGAWRRLWRFPLLSCGNRHKRLPTGKQNHCVYPIKPVEY